MGPSQPTMQPRVTHLALCNTVLGSLSVILGPQWSILSLQLDDGQGWRGICDVISARFIEDQVILSKETNVRAEARGSAEQALLTMLWTLTRRHRRHGREEDRSRRLLSHCRRMTTSALQTTKRQFCRGRKPRKAKRRRKGPALRKIAGSIGRHSSS